MSASTQMILLTALAQEQHQFTRLALGADAYLVKLVDIHEVVATVQRVVLIGEEERQKRMQGLLEQSEAADDDWLDPSFQQETEREHGTEKR